MRSAHRGVVGLALIAAARVAQGDTLVLVPSADNSIFRDLNFPELQTSSGVGDSIFCGRTYVHAEILQRGLVRFDTSLIPCGSTIQNVKLTMAVSRARRGTPVNTIALHRLLSGWGEGGSNSFGGRGEPSQPGDANWVARVYPGVLWTTPGGDFASVASAVTSVSDNAASAAWTSTPMLIADVASWVNTPGVNFGWILVGNEVDAGSARGFHSREAGAGLRPTLQIDFTPPASLSIQTQPQGVTACPQVPTSVVVRAPGASGFAWQWRVGGGAWRSVIEGSNSDGGSTSFVAAGASGEALTIVPSAGPVVVGLRCLVSNSCQSVESDAADVVVLSATDPSCGPACDPDVNQDGNADQGDIDYLINVVAGGDNPSGTEPDFNRDGNADQGDVDSLINVVAGGACP